MVILPESLKIIIGDYSMLNDVKLAIANRVVSSITKIIDALKQMDEFDIKLLVVFSGEQFEGLLSLGDIQRAILDNVSLDLPVSNIMRTDCKVASREFSEQAIKELMLKERIECMPIVDNGEIVDIYLWDDLFTNVEKCKTLNVPVVIMAGGKGNRLKPLTNIIPKPLVPIGEKPIVEVIIDSFCGYGVNDFLLSVNYKSEMIKNYFANIDHSYNVDFFQESSPLGTAGSLYLVKNKIKGTFFVTNCDILIQQDYNVVYDYHKENNNEITMIASLMHHEIPYGTLESGKRGELISMKEKPELTYMVNVGVYILEASVLDCIGENEFIHITDLIEQLRSQGKRIGVLILTMLGPGYGHNIEPYLDFFNRHSSTYRMIFIYWGRLEFGSKYKEIDFISFRPRNYFKILKQIRGVNVDLIWQHGNNVLIFAFIRVFKRRGLVHFLNIWSDRLYLEIKKNKIKKVIANLVLNKAFIHCYWYTTANNIQSEIPVAVVHAIDCGMHRHLFETPVLDCISADFMELLNDVGGFQGKKFFYPKSMTDASGHLLILNAAQLLVVDGVTNFTVVFRRGNEINDIYESELKKYVVDNGLETNVVFQEYFYLSFAELSLLWQQMDCGLQIAFHDQLSTTFLEPMLFEKEIIASDIEPYQIYRDKFNIHLNLYELKSTCIAEAMKRICLNQNTDLDILAKRRKIVESNFNFEDNVAKIIRYYSGL